MVAGEREERTTPRVDGVLCSHTHRMMRRRRSTVTTLLLRLLERERENGANMRKIKGDRRGGGVNTIHCSIKARRPSRRSSSAVDTHVTRVLSVSIAVSSSGRLQFSSATMVRQMSMASAYSGGSGCWQYNFAMRRAALTLVSAEYVAARNG
jgi:hypothetical protein